MLFKGHRISFYGSGFVETQSSLFSFLFFQAACIEAIATGGQAQLPLASAGATVSRFCLIKSAVCRGINATYQKINHLFIRVGFLLN